MKSYQDIEKERKILLSARDKIQNVMNRKKSFIPWAVDSFTEEEVLVLQKITNDKPWPIFNKLKKWFDYDLFKKDFSAQFTLIFITSDIVGVILSQMFRILNDYIPFKMYDSIDFFILIIAFIILIGFVISFPLRFLANNDFFLEKMNFRYLSRFHHKNHLLKKINEQIRFLEDLAFQKDCLDLNQELEVIKIQQDKLNLKKQVIKEKWEQKSLDLVKIASEKNS